MLTRQIARRKLARPSCGIVKRLVNQSSRDDQFIHLAARQQELRNRALIVQIDDEHAPSVLAHRDSQVRRDRRLADAAFEVHERKDRSAALTEGTKRRRAGAGGDFPDPSIADRDRLELLVQTSRPAAAISGKPRGGVVSRGPLSAAVP